ncbi:hypothetical protein ACKI1I_25045 [Streptomyces turgidiscabies]|uniref:Uncharacterized protein n=1 Tax=Streptomyces turgidiscabies (strain Car8) TaxID=698760 RepID=L7EWE8_STRT8|nr:MULTISPECIES: hypothetical protein [Streptomyces]ELP63189.1 hypothetical protein STRTUCAR8_00539 [Streptomyces turgidiscabies Car8]MDX3499677.1 hypothetical protein [Streptomyces turgidiscabies]GAQ73378.1 hypothetical protein T45_05136 [Streptomyces turgidiscabies]
MVLPAAPEERAGTVAACYVLSYLAMSVPAVLAGSPTTWYGSKNAVLLYAGTAGVLALVALATATGAPTVTDAPRTSSTAPASKGSAS